MGRRGAPAPPPLTPPAKSSPKVPRTALILASVSSAAFFRSGDGRRGRTLPVIRQSELRRYSARRSCDGLLRPGASWCETSVMAVVGVCCDRPGNGEARIVFHYDGFGLGFFGDGERDGVLARVYQGSAIASKPPRPRRRPPPPPAASRIFGCRLARPATAALGLRMRVQRRLSQHHRSGHRRVPTAPPAPPRPPDRRRSAAVWPANRADEASERMSHARRLTIPASRRGHSAGEHRCRPCPSRSRTGPAVLEK